ncbi:MAG: twin-arginine translocation signal domain-containing protein, partial [Pedobacter sp.]
MNRRQFVRNAGLTTAAIAAIPDQTLFASQADEKIKVVMIGVGLRGQNHLNLLLKRADVDLVAICDVDDRMIQMSKAIIAKSGKPMPKIFTGSKDAWKKLLELKGIKAVVIATPWELHKPMILGALDAGIKYVATEVVLGINLEDHWDV